MNDEKITAKTANLAFELAHEITEGPDRATAPNVTTREVRKRDTEASAKIPTLPGKTAVLVA